MEERTKQRFEERLKLLTGAERDSLAARLWQLEILEIELLQDVKMAVIAQLGADAWNATCVSQRPPAPQGEGAYMPEHVSRTSPIGGY